MKVPPKRKGKTDQFGLNPSLKSLNESPSEKEGKRDTVSGLRPSPWTLNESPSEKEGKCEMRGFGCGAEVPSMKVPPKRKGNLSRKEVSENTMTLNESPSEKEGKRG